jgi:type I restriction enzyme S subunit
MISAVRDRIDQIRRGKIPEGYIKTVSGLAPAEWNRHTFGDIYVERKEPGNEDLPLLMVSIHSGVSNGEVAEEELPKRVKRIADKSQYKKAVSGDLVFNMMRAWQGAIGTVRTTGMVSPAYIVAEPNDKVYPMFMYYYTRTPQMIYQIARQSYGVTDFRKRLYWDSFTPISCALPPIEEQKKIAVILADQDKIIELKEKLMAEKQRQKKYLMQQLLPGKKRLPGFNEKWKEKRFCEIFTFGTTNTFSREYMCEDSSGVKNIHYGDILVRYGEILRLSEQEIPSLLSEVGSEITSFVDDGDVVIADTAEDLTAGKAIEIQETQGKKVAAGLHTMLCKPTKGRFAFGWLGYYMNSEYYHRQLIPYIAEIKVMSISKGNIVKTNILVPSVEEQAAIVQVLSTADRELDLLRQDIEQEKQKKKALMQLLLTGIVRVNV